MMTENELIINGNEVKQLVLKKLLKDNVITEEEFQEYNVNHQIIVAKRSWFKSFFDFHKINDDKLYAKYVKFIS